MPDLTPFRALRYAPRAGRPQDLVAPPYDVISPEEHVALARRSPHNVVRLILGERPSPADPPPADWHHQAAASLARWRRSGILQADPRPALYLYTQRFPHHGTSRTRKLLLGALRLEPYATGRIHPHENTLAGPKADRLRLLQATRANLSPILGFFPDPGGAVNRQLDELPAATPDLDFTDDSGLGHELRRIEAPTIQGPLRQALASQPLYIADGHHRYETALAYRDLQRQRTDAPPGTLPCEFTLAACMSAADPGVLILPTHRAVSWEGAPAVAELLDRAREAFQVSALPARGAEDALAALRAGGDRRAFVVTPGAAPGTFALLSLRDEAALEGAPYAPGSPARRLAAVAFHCGLLAGLPPTVSTAIHYTPSAEEALRAVEEKRARLAALLPSLAPEDVMSVVDAGERLPPKSTYFWPKPLTGIVLRSLDNPDAA